MLRFLDQNHVVSGIAPHDINGAAHTTDYVSLANWDHVTALLHFGVITTAGDSDIVVTVADDVAGTHTTTLNNYSIKKSPGATTAAGDVFAADVAISDSKIDLVAAGDIVPVTDNGCIVAIEIDAAQILAAGTAYRYSCLAVTIPDPGQSTFVGVTFVLSRGKNLADPMPTAIA